MREAKQGDSPCGYPRDCYPLRRSLRPATPMEPASDEMPEDEQLVRDFLARHRPPAGKSAWTEVDVERALRSLQQGHRL